MLLQINPATGRIMTGFTGLALTALGTVTILPTQFSDGTFWSDGTGWDQ